MRFHPAVFAALKVALRRVPVPPALRLYIFPAWRNALPSVNTVLDRHNFKLSMGREFSRGGTQFENMYKSEAHNFAGEGH